MTEVQERLDSYLQKAEEIVKAVREERIPLEEGNAALAEIRANHQDDSRRLADLPEAIGEIRRQEVPWYYYLGPVATAVLAFLGGRVPGWRAQRVLGAVIEGVEKTEDLSLKESIREAAELHGVGPELHRVVRKAT